MDGSEEQEVEKVADPVVRRTVEESSRLSAAPRRRLLIVEDEPVLAELLQDVFQQGGYEVVVAHNVADGLLAARREQPHLCVTDFLLPDRTGLDFARALFEIGEAPPVVMVTAFLEPELEIEIDAEPAIEMVVRKPMDVFALRADVDRILDERSTDA